MKRTLSGLVGVGVVILVAVFCLFNVDAVNAATTTIKLQTIYPKSSDNSQDLLFFAERVEQYTKGEVEIKIFWPGQLVNAKEVFSALQRGMIEGYMAAGLYFSGVVPELNGAWLPYAWENPKEGIDVYLNFGYLDVMREVAEREGVYYVAPISVATMGLMTKFPVHKLEDLKGKKIKTSGIGGEVVKALGAAPTALAPSELYIALQRGTVDGAYYPWYPIETYRLHEVVGYLISPAFNTPGFVDLMLNRKVWEKLSPSCKQAIDRAGMETMWRSALTGLLRDQRSIKFGREKGVKEIEVPPEEIKRFRELILGVYESHAKKSVLCARQVEIIKKYWEEKGR